MQVIDWLAKHAAYSPEKLALIEVATGRRFSYQELNRQANRFCAYLYKLGIKPGDRVSVLLPNCIELLFVLFGATKLGAIFVPLNFKLAIPELIPILSDAQPALLIYSSEFAGVATALQNESNIAKVLNIDTILAEIESLPSENPQEIPADIESPQMLLYTSGTTGTPKGVILSHRMVLWNSINTSIRMLTPDDTALVHTPMFYTGGLNVYTLPAFYLGATVAILKIFSAADVLHQVERLKITVLFAVPTQLAMMADSDVFQSADLSSLRYLISGGAPCPVPLIQRWIKRGIPLRQGFGLTEAGPNCFALDARDAVRKAGSIGFPNFSIEARIVDDDGVEAAAGAVGELIMRTPAMCSGYWNNPDQTSTAIRNGWFHTGDLAMRDEEGYCYIVDRKKDMFISGGENVYPAQIEHLLGTHPKVAEVAVIGVPHPKWGEVGCAAVVVRSGESLTAEELLGFCSGKIARFKIPRSVVFVSELPRTISGKVRKQLLKETALVPLVL